ncbi:hypothetical protein F4861DRAFT_292826 [Xylaria intraflava]|nr:hypothetical protein F4861DRAFT_292826 [Xylaria intraflava]
MPRVRLPRVNLKLGFFKKLLHRRSDPEVVVSESTADVGSYQRKDEKNTAALEEPPLEECPICHDPVGLENPEGILESWVHLHCNHKFGTQCIQTWLQESAERDPHSMPSCPICRTTAKHPCGHPVIMPTARLSPFALWATLPPAPPTPPPTYRQNRRPRRRLSRRWGHPHRPLPSRPSAPSVQTVGKCNICAATAAQETMSRQMTMSSIDMETTYGGRARNSDRRTGIKSMLMQTSLRRLGGSAVEPARTENYTTRIDALGDQPILTLAGPGTHREYVNQCRTRAAVSHTPATPGRFADP